jgi:ABC-type transport system involved in multi-copper enzyme maturation permease subunit
MQVWAIAFNTFREAIRNKILYSLLFFAGLVIVGSILIGDLAVGGRIKIVKDMGLGAISVFGLLIAIFVGIDSIYKEVEKGTICTLLSKPISRSTFLWSKFLGLALLLLVEVAVMSVVLVAIVYFLTGTLIMKILAAIFLIYFELLIITSLTIFFSTFSTPTLSGLFTVGFYVLGHLTSEISSFSKITPSKIISFLCKVSYYLLPNLENLNIKSQVVFDLPISFAYLAYSISYALGYLIIVLLLSMFIFSKKDFT